MSTELVLAFRGELSALSEADRNRLMTREPSDGSDVRRDVARILEDVATRGDAALYDMAERFDGVSITSVEVSRATWDVARDELDPVVRRALERARTNIEAFHRAQIPDDVTVEPEPGIALGRRFVPVSTAGVYAPGGTAAYPSSVLMGVVPARAVGVTDIVVCSPPGPNGLPSREVLAAASIGGATRLFAVGGAGAIGAMAFGTKSVPRCSVVVGPGNRWVIEAKRQVAGAVRIDAPAGPSEVLVLADENADPNRVAAELIAQAEHDPDAAVVALCIDSELITATERAVTRQLEDADRAAVVLEALRNNGGLLSAASRDEALGFVNAWAPEHLSIMTQTPEKDLEEIRTAGTVFLGSSSSVAHGDYLTGANHVLPTAGTATSFSGLSALDYLRSYTWQRVNAEGAKGMVTDVTALALAEGLPGHAAAAAAAAESSESMP